MTLREQICELVDLLDAKGHGELGSAPCWVIVDQHGGTRSFVFCLNDGLDETWFIAGVEQDHLCRLDREDVENMKIEEVEPGSFNFERFRQSRRVN